MCEMYGFMLQELLIWPKMVIFHLSCSGDSATHHLENKYVMLLSLVRKQSPCLWQGAIAHH
jgi:hypothetical protein